MTVLYPLRLFFDCSTAHLSEASRAYLFTLAEAGETMIASTPYGWFLWCTGDIDDDVPADLADIMRYACTLHAEYILFDADAPIDENLPTFDWGG